MIYGNFETNFTVHFVQLKLKINWKFTAIIKNLFINFSIDCRWSIFNIIILLLKIMVIFIFYYLIFKNEF